MRHRTWLVVVMMALCQFIVPAARAQEAADISFATPEEGIAYLVEKLRTGDLAGAIEAFAIDERVEGYSFVGMGTYLGAVVLYQNSPPVRYDAYRELGRIQFTAEAAMQLRALTYSLLLPAEMPFAQLVVVPKTGSEDFMSDLETSLDPARLANLKLVRAGDPSPDMTGSDTYRKNVARRLGVMGGDDMVERIAEYDLDGKAFGGGFTFVRYGERWKIFNLSSPIGGTPATGAATPIP